MRSADGGRPDSAAALDGQADLTSDPVVGPLDSPGTTEAPTGEADGAVDAVAGGDAGDGPGASGDVAPGMACSSAADCAGLPAAPVLPHCGGGTWSCLRATAGPGRCVRECMSPARTCAGAANNCIDCNAPGAAPSCPATACVVPPGGYTLEGTTCAVPPAFDREDCRGGFVFHASGLCSVQLLATGAIRFALACPGCTSIFMVR